MKRVVCIVLAAVTVAAILASCAPARSTGAVAANVRLTSSDAVGAAEWLTARLGEVQDRVVIGTDASAYGVDVSALEDDGYVIRSLGDETAVFARTAEGLDRAVRRYAKAVEAGERAGDVTYHEGRRIEELRLAGNDVSTYAIRVESDNDYVRTWVTDNVAGTFSTLLGIACGFAPEVGGEAEHHIIFRHVERDGWKDSSYGYHFEAGEFVIEFTGIYGAKNGALLFLENECGWEDLISGCDALAEADLIDVPPTLEGGLCQCIRSPHSTLREVNPSLAEYSYKIPSAHHALGSQWASDFGLSARTGHYPCLTDDEVYETVVGEICDHVASRLSAGEKLGDGMAHIDLGMEDGDVSAGNTFCNCKNCREVYVDEGGTWAGPMIRFANRVEESVDKAGYDGIKYSVFAYAGSNMPPRKTAPNDDLYITIVMHDACDKHFMDGSQCDGNSGNSFMINWVRSYTGGQRWVNNNDWGQWIRDWRALGAHLYVRVATLTNVFHPYMTMYIQYENMKFFAENGVMAIYNESYSSDGLDFNHVVAELYNVLHYYPDLSRADYYAEFDRILEKYYGDGWRDVRAICDLMREAELGSSCSCAWGGGAVHYDTDTYLSLWEQMIAHADAAIRAANGAFEERFCRLAKCIVLHVGCRYTYAKYGADGEEFALAKQRWADMVAELASVGYPILDAETDLAGVYHQGAATGHVIFFKTETGVWPLTWSLCPTLEEELGLD